jgi:hypothetical protein
LQARDGGLELRTRMPGWGTDDILALRFESGLTRWQRSLRWARPARSWRRLVSGFALGVFCTALQLALFDAGMRIERKRVQMRAPDVPIEVELLTAPAPAPPVEAATNVSSQRVARERRLLPAEAPSPPAVTGTQGPVEPQPSAPLQLFGRDGAVRLPDSVPDQRTFGTPNGKPLAHENPVPYEETRFDRMMPSVRESLGDEVMRRTTYTRTWTTRSGTRIQCGTSLLMAGLGFCGWGVAPRATADELRAMRADPPMPKTPKDDAGE